MSIILLDPAAEGVPDFLPTADRLKELAGKRIGLLDNIKHNAEYLLASVGAGFTVGSVLMKWSGVNWS